MHLMNVSSLRNTDKAQSEDVNGMQTQIIKATFPEPQTFLHKDEISCVGIEVTIVSFVQPKIIVWELPQH